MARHIVLLIVVSIFVPPVGLILLGLYILKLLAKRAERDGGVVTRARYDAWAKEEPWWTGDVEADQRRIAEIRAERGLA